jgi:hypothetical protein
MNFPENKPVDIGGITFNLIPYLTFEETLNIAKICVEVYEEGVTNTENNKIYDGILGWDKNLFLMEQAFDLCLINFCTDLSEYQYDVLVAYGITEFIKDNVVNARETFQKINKIIEKKETMESIIEKGIAKLIEKIPSAKELKGLYSIVKKDMSSGKFNELFEKTKDIFDISKRN